MALRILGHDTITNTAYTQLSPSQTTPTRCFLCCTINCFVKIGAAGANQLILFSVSGSSSAHMVDLGVVAPSDVFVQASFAGSPSTASLFALDPGEAR